MAVVQLATSADVKAELGRDLTASESARVGAILDKASELFRARSKQIFTEGESTVRLKVNGGRVYLPQTPVIEVLSVTTDHGHPVQYDQDGQWLTTCLASDRFVWVHYTHGGVIPDLVRLTVAGVARKVLQIDPNAATGLTQHSRTTGPFTDSWTYATWAQGGQTMLAPSDAEVADSFKVTVPTVWVQS